MLTALVLGGAKCVWQDAERALALFKPDAVAAVNDMIGDWPHKIDYAISLHPEKLHLWMPKRVARQAHKPEVWASKMERPRPNRQPLWPVDRVADDWAGSSGLFAVRVLRGDGFERIVCAGVPMEPAEAHYHNDRAWMSAQSFQRAWLTRRAEIAPYVRSMSGWTLDLLGPPTPEWLAGA